MKTTRIGKIGAITAGAAMLGTAVAGALAGAAVTSDLTAEDVGLFFGADMTPNVQLVIGEKAQASDGAAAGRIAAVIGNLAYATAAKTETKAVDVPEVTKTCPSASCIAAPGEESASGEVKLSFASTGVVGDLEQKAMDCNIYADQLSMNYSTEGGDSGSYCDLVTFRDANSEYIETYIPDTSLQSISWSQCSSVSSAGAKPLKSAEFENEICTICYDYCELALNQEPHLMSEWVDIDCDEVRLRYNCDNEQLELEVGAGALTYTIFTDDILTDDILDTSDNLIGQTYIGKILLGQQEFFTESLSEDKITVVKGESIKGVTTAAPATYTTPNGEEYQIALVGAQTLEESGVVDVTLEVTKPDGTKVQVTTGISGTPIVGDLKIKLQRGNAATNVITGESSFTSDLLVWFIPSEYTFEDDERYTEAGVEDDNGIWRLSFNDGEAITVLGLEDLETDENFTDHEVLPDDIEENDHYTGGYNDADMATYNTTRVVRGLRFVLTDDVDLTIGQKVQLPFNNGKYLLSDLKFGYEGLADEDFNNWDNVDKTTITLERNAIDVYNRSEEKLTREAKVTIKYTDKWDDDLTVRIDQGPYSEGDLFFVAGKVYKLKSVEPTTNVDDGVVAGEYQGNVTLELAVKDSKDWDDLDDCVLVNMTAAAVPAVGNITVNSVLANVIADVEYNQSAVCIAGTRLYADYADNGLSPELLIYSDLDNDKVMDIDNGATDVDTKFDDTVWFSANNGVITVDGKSDSGADTPVLITMFNTTYAGIGVPTFVNVTPCDKSDTCSEFNEGDEDGKLISLDGTEISIDSAAVEEPDGATDIDLIDSVTLVVPRDQMRPTIFFGTSSTSNSTSLSITEADVGSVVNIGGVDVTVEEFGVVGSVSGGGVTSTGNATTITCGGGTADVSVSYDETSVKSIGYSLVVVEGQQISGKTLVLIGGPVVNSLTKEVVKEIKEGEQLIKKAGSKLVVAGYTAADTQAAADELVKWLKTNVHA